MSLDLVDFEHDPVCVQNWRFLQEHLGDGPEFEFLESVACQTVKAYYAGEIGLETADRLTAMAQADAMEMVIDLCIERFNGGTA